MVEQEYRLRIPDGKTWDAINKEYFKCLKRAVIFDSDYYDTPDLKLLDKGIMLRQRFYEGKIFVQAKKKVAVKDDVIIVSEMKEEMQKEITAAKLYSFVLSEQKIDKVEKIMTLHSKRHYFNCEKFSFILDSSDYHDYLRKADGSSFELRMEVFTKRQEDLDFLKGLEKKYGLTMVTANKLQRIMLGMGE
ncbi:CYTH domain-containing protein [Patescibacteria group bacterium]|nr:CYTH domain-containing protein [Patescibacteria group bacterium]MBU1673319.1 CYTH domain-containing protein [Patescibacteria group bacterium]MBU1963562.1 CYTH domain-containing protein [Patescibacteria group bacterium]